MLQPWLRVVLCALTSKIRENKAKNGLKRMLHCGKGMFISLKIFDIWKEFGTKNLVNYNLLKTLNSKAKPTISGLHYFFRSSISRCKGNTK